MYFGRSESLDHDRAKLTCIYLRTGTVVVETSFPVIGSYSSPRPARTTASSHDKRVVQARAYLASRGQRLEVLQCIPRPSVLLCFLMGTLVCAASAVSCGETQRWGQCAGPHAAARHVLVGVVSAAAVCGAIWRLDAPFVRNVRSVLVRHDSSVLLKK